MTPPRELAALVAEYSAGLDVELRLLKRLQELAAQQREATQTGDLTMLGTITDVRDTVMANLVTLEHQLKPIRLVIADHCEQLADDARFQDVARRHREAAAHVASILSWDRDSLDALKEAELARSFAARALEQGESTLAAYRRVVAPRVSGATLFNRKG
jgi:hypothetical protein